MWHYYLDTRRAQGWKLHVSIREGDLNFICAAAIPILNEEAVPYKVLKSEDHLQLLNSGRYGSTQVGKAITLYPKNDEECVRLALRLASHLPQLAAPVIENELRFGRSNVYARYGSFKNSDERNLLGIFESSITTCDGRKIVDNRESVGHLESGVELLFPGSVFYAPQVISEKYKLIKRLVDKGYSATYSALDLSRNELCVVRIAKRHTCIDGAGLDAADRAVNEYYFLKKFSSSGFTPNALGYTEFADYVVVSRSWILGKNLSSIFAYYRSTLKIKEIVAKLCVALNYFHKVGICLADLTPSNIIVGNKGDIFFVDLEAAVQIDDLNGAAYGTEGYTQPQYLKGAPPSIETDLYSVTAICYALATQIDLSKVPNGSQVFAQRAYVSQSFASFLDLLEAATSATSAFKIIQNIPKLQKNYNWRQCALPAKTDQLIRSLCASAVMKDETIDESKPIWRSSVKGMDGLISTDVYAGSAGVILGILRAGHAIQDQSLIDYAIQVGEKICKQAKDEKLPGLFIGKAGIGWLALSIYAVTANVDWLQRALEIGVRLNANNSPDLFHGQAGILLFLTWLYRHSGDKTIRNKALRLSNTLIIKVNGQKVPRWPIPYGYSELSGHSWNGIAHGSAGICLALAEAGSEFEQVNTLEVCRNYFDDVDKHVTTEGDFRIPDRHGGTFKGGVWCHGIGGIAWSVKKGHDLGLTKLDPAKLANIAYSDARKSDFSLCHGMASVIDLLLCFPNISRRIDSLIHYLVTSYVRVDSGYAEIIDQSRKPVSADFMVGAGGVISTLSRALYPERLGYFMEDPLISIKH